MAALTRPSAASRATLARWNCPGAVDPAEVNWNVVGRAAILAAS
ncbi:hypothetical protein OHB49_05580 [Streptomyces sp. NBC_01717]|nr:hypothetical protein [Streptomyces sp. NBC_01717]